MLLLFPYTVLAGQATLSWTAPSTNTDGTSLTDLAGYKVYYGTAPGSYSQVITLGNTTSYTVTNLTGGVPYYFAATAYDTAWNESPFSNEVSKTSPPTLTVNKTGAGTVTGPSINCGTTCAATYGQGTIITLNGTVNAGAAFGGWSGGGCSGSGPCVTTMNTDTTITAAFSPVAGFSGAPLSGQAPLYVVFTDSSAGSPSSWAWTFGDGYTDTKQTPGHVYMTPGTYTVSLAATNAGGTSSLSIPNYVTVSACPNQRVRIARATPVYFPTLQDAYNAAVTGDIIQSQAFNFTESLTFNSNISVTLRGGFDCSYTSNPAVTTLKGAVALSNGAVSFEHIDMYMP